MDLQIVTGKVELHLLYIPALKAVCYAIAYMCLLSTEIYHRETTRTVVGQLVFSPTSLIGVEIVMSEDSMKELEEVIFSFSVTHI